MSRSRIATYVRSGCSKGRLGADDVIELHSQGGSVHSGTWERSNVSESGDRNGPNLPRPAILTKTTITMSSERDAEEKSPLDYSRLSKALL